MRGTVIFDFDYTLFDTTRFKKAWVEIGLPAITDRMHEFVFPGVPKVLDHLKAQGWKLALLTLGEPGWQTYKVECSGLKERFDHVICTPNPKIERIADFADWPRPLIFVNDHGGELDRLQSLLPEARMIAVRSHKPLPTSPNIPICSSLDEIISVIV